MIAFMISKWGHLLNEGILKSSRYHKILDIHISCSSYYPDNSVISLTFDFNKTIKIMSNNKCVKRNNYVQFLLFFPERKPKLFG